MYRIKRQIICRNKISAEAGIQISLDKNLLYFWIPASAGMTIIFNLKVKDLTPFFYYSGLVYNLMLENRVKGQNVKVLMEIFE